MDRRDVTVRTHEQWRWSLMTALSVGPLVIALLSCAVPKIDGSSTERAVASLRAVRQSVPAADRERFDKDLTFVLGDGGRVTPVLDDAAARARINGKTADDVFRAATALRVERARQDHEAKVKAELASIHDSLGRIEAKDKAVKVTLARPLTPSVLEPDSPEVSRSSDPQIAALCGRFPPDDEFARQECEEQELSAKGKLSKAIPSSFSTDIANRLRLSCAQRQPQSYRARLACVMNGVRIIPYALKNPAILDNLPPEERIPIEQIIGRQ